MKSASFKLYLIFVATFLVMHFTGTMASRLPYILNALITSITVLGALFFMLNWDNKSSFEQTSHNLGFKITSINKISAGIILASALLLSYPLLSLVLNVEIMLSENWFLNLSGLFLTAGITEEMLFRGYLFGSLRRKMSFRKAAFISTVCFTLAHLVMFSYMPWQVALLSTLLAVTTSVPLAFLFEKGNNTLWGAAIVHTAIRTIGLVVTTDEIHFMTFSMWWISVIMVLPYAVLLFYKEFRTLWTKQF